MTDPRSNAEKSESGSESSVSGALGVILRISRVFGVAPVSFNKIRGGKPELIARASRPHAIYGYILITVVGILLLVALSFDNVKWKGLIMSTIIYLIHLFGLISIASFGAYGGICRITRMLHNLHKLNEITARQTSINYDEMMSREKKQTMKVLLALLLVAIIVSIYFVLDVTGQEASIPCFLLYMMVFFMAGLLETQIVLMISAVGTGLRTLSFQLQKLTALLESEHPSNMSHIYSLRESIKAQKKNIQRIFQSYEDICEMVNDMNEADGGLVLIMFTSNTLFLIDSIYAILQLGYTKGDIRSWTYFCMEFFWAFIIISLLISFSEVSHRAVQHALKIRIMLCDSLPEGLAVPLEPQSFKMAVHCDALFHKLVLTPLDIVEFNRPLLTKVISFIVSCLTIIIQYKTASPRKST